MYRDTIGLKIRLINQALASGQYQGIKYLYAQFGNGRISKMRFTAPGCWNYLNEKLLEIIIDNYNWD